MVTLKTSKTLLKYIFLVFVLMRIDDSRNQIMMSKNEKNKSKPKLGQNYTLTRSHSIFPKIGEFILYFHDFLLCLSA